MRKYLFYCYYFSLVVLVPFKAETGHFRFINISCKVLRLKLNLNSLFLFLFYIIRNLFAFKFAIAFLCFVIYFSSFKFYRYFQWTEINYKMVTMNTWCVYVTKIAWISISMSFCAWKWEYVLKNSAILRFWYTLYKLKWSRFWALLIVNIGEQIYACVRVYIDLVYSNCAVVVISRRKEWVYFLFENRKKTYLWWNMKFNFVICTEHPLFINWNRLLFLHSTHVSCMFIYFLILVYCAKERSTTNKLLLITQLTTDRYQLKTN